MKKCYTCKQIKDLTSFPKHSSYEDGLNNHCKPCVNSRNKAWRDKNPDKAKEISKKQYWKDRDKNILKKREYYENHRNEKAAYDKIYREENKIKIAEYKKKWEKNKIETDISFRIAKNLRRRIIHAIQDNYKSAHTVELLGCDIEFFMKHLESQFKEGMSWDNYGLGGWHVDHIVECWRFDLSKPEEQKKCFHYSNLRPLWEHDNISRPRVGFHNRPSISS